MGNFSLEDVESIGILQTSTTEENVTAEGRKENA